MNRLDQNAERTVAVNRARLGLIALGVLVLVGCSTGIRARNDVPQATLQAYQTQVGKLQNQVAAQRATLAAYTPLPATPIPPKFAAQWAVTLSGKPALKPKVGVSDDLTPMAAKGIYLVVPITVTNKMSAASYFNPAGVIVAVDAKKHKYDLDANATSAAYVLDLQGDPARGALQPGISYPDVLVFDVPKNAAGFTLKSTDSTFSVKLGI